MVDDCAMNPLDEHERRLFLEICDDRYRRRSTVLSSQLPVASLLPVASWHKQIGLVIKCLRTEFMPLEGKMNLPRRSLRILLAPLLLRAQTTDTEEELSRFHDWQYGPGLKLVRDQAPLPQVLAAYRQKLIQDGMKPADADGLMSRLEVQLRKGPGPRGAAQTRQTFNRMYSAIQGQESSRTTNPNAFLAEIIGNLHPGRALDLGMGLGRNSIFLAQKGWDVTGIDLSEVAIAAAQKRARQLGVQMKAMVADVNQFELGTDQWDLVCVLYFVIDETMPNLYQRITKGLKPGGLVLIEGVGHGGGLDNLLGAWSEWEPTRLHLLRLEYGGRRFGLGRRSSHAPAPAKNFLSASNRGR